MEKERIGLQHCCLPIISHWYLSSLCTKNKTSVHYCASLRLGKFIQYQVTYVLLK